MDSPPEPSSFSKVWPPWRGHKMERWSGIRCFRCFRGINPHPSYHHISSHPVDPMEQCHSSSGSDPKSLSKSLKILSNCRKLWQGWLGQYSLHRIFLQKSKEAWARWHYSCWISYVCRWPEHKSLGSLGGTCRWESLLDDLKAWLCQTQRAWFPCSGVARPCSHWFPDTQWTEYGYVLYFRLSSSIIFYDPHSTDPSSTVAYPMSCCEMGRCLFASAKALEVLHLKFYQDIWIICVWQRM